MNVSRVLLNAYNIAMRWSNRPKTNGGYFSILKQRIRSFLLSLSGNDLTSMLCDVLTKSEITILGNRYVQALRDIS